MKAVISDNGVLVPMRDAMAPEWMQVSGVMPAKAKELLAKEKVAAQKAKDNQQDYTPRYSLAKIPKGVETVEIDDEEPTPDPKKETDSRDEIVIPEDWTEMKSKPHLLVKLAKLIDKNINDADAATAAIESEIKRREETKASS